jgi:hypothetical protein
MIKKLVFLFAAAAALALMARAGSASWSVNVSYPVNPSQSNNATVWFPSGTTFDASMSGVGQGGGVALAHDTVSGNHIAIVNTGGGPGMPFSGFSTGTISTATTVYISTHLAVSTSGSYGNSTVTANW